MTTAAQVAKQAQYLGKQLQAVIEVGTFLEELGDLEQAISEAKGGYRVAFEERMEAEQLRDLVAAALEAEQANLQAVKDNAQKILDDANAASDQLVADARKTASDTIGKATAGANKAVQDATVAVQQLQRKKVALAGKTAELEAEYTTLKRGFRALLERTEVE